MGGEWRIARCRERAGLVLSLATDLPGRAAAGGITAEQADSFLAEVKQIRVLLEAQLRQSAARQGVPAAVADRNVTLPPGKDLSVAQAAGITGTPSFVLGKTTKAGTEGVVLVGNIPYEVLEARIRDLLSK